MTKHRISITEYAPVALFIAILVLGFGAHAGTTNVTLAWNANTETNLAGYRVYYGTAAGTYSASKLVGAEITSTSISNLTSGQTYYFAAKATNTAGLESVFSTEISTLAPSAPNTAPVALAQSLTTPEDTAKAVTLTGTDADGNALSFAIVSSANYGALSGTLPNITYTPPANFNGTDSFVYKANDGITDSAPVTVTITVTPVNDAPVAIAQSVSTVEDTAKAITLAASDVDGNALTYTIVAAPANGTLSGSGASRTYTPTANYSGSDSFTFKVNDGTVDSAVAMVSIPVTAVNDPPVASAQSITTTEDVATSVTLTGSDLDGNPLTYAIVTPPTQGTLTGTAPNVTYKPATNYNGSDSFTFRANDGTTNSAAATVFITVTAVNDAPVAVAQSVSTAEDTAKTITLAGSDADGDALTYAIVTSPAHGTLSGSLPNVTYLAATNYNGSDSFTFKANDGTVDSAAATVSINVTAANDAPVAIAQSVTTAEDTAKAVTMAATDADGNALTYSVTAAPTHGTLSGTAPNLTYTPTANYNGNDSFSFKANDGTVDSAAATVAITISAVNDAPLASAQSVATTEDTAKGITLAGSDADGDALTYLIVTAPTHGALGGSAPNVTYTPTANYNGSDSFSFKANDGTVDSAVATVSIAVAAANDAPIAIAQNVTTTEDTAKAIPLAATDVDGNALTYSVTAAPAHGTLSGTAPNLTYTPTANYNGGDSFAFKANDGTVDSPSATVSITVSAVNDVPLASAQSVATDKNVASAVTLAGSDADSDPLTFVVVTQPTKGTLSGTAPSLVYTPNFNVTGNDSFTFKANDGTADSAAATIAINIAAGPNTAPVADTQSIAATEDVSKSITLTATDVDGDALAYTVTTGPAHGTLTGTAPNLTYTPTTNYNGSDTFWFRANDGLSNSALAVVSLAVNAVNDAPLATSQSITALEDTAKAVTLAGSDVDGDALTYTVTVAPAHGTLSGSGANLTYLPATNYNGADSFSFKANDGTVDSAVATVAINVTAANDAPLAIAQSATTTEDTAKAVTLGGTDADGNTLTYTVVAQPAHGTLSGTAPNLSYKPATNYNGTDSFTFKVNDGTVDSSPATVSVDVSAVNDAPLASAQSVATDKNVAKAVTLGGSDVDGDPLTFVVVTQPTKGILSGTAPNLTYTPNFNVTGTDSFTFKANDGTVDSAAATIAINIAAGPNTAPVADAQSVTATEDVAKPITLTATDVDGDALSYAVTTAPAHGTLSGIAPNLTYLPATNYNGSDTFWFRANDGLSNSALAVVSITVNPANDAPTATSQSFTTAEDTAKAITLAGSDTDGDPLTFTVTVPPSHGTLSGPGANLTYLPATNYNGSDSFSFNANDGTVDSTTATVSITVAPANDAPVASAQNVAAVEDATKAITLGGTDADGNVLTYALVTQPAHGTLSGTAPNVSYKPATNFNGSDSFTFKANDGTLDSPAAMIAITVAPANDAPLAIEQSVATDKNVAKAITLGGSDVDGDALTFTVATQPAKGTLSGTAPNLTYTPNNNITGADVFTFKANDGTVDSAAAAIYININAGPNTAPVASAQDVTTAEDTAKAITLVATDADGNAITYGIVTPPLHGTLSGAAPNVTYTPAADYSGSDTFWFKASDGVTNSVPAVVSITITPVNDPPTLNPIANVTLAGGAGAQTISLGGISAGSNESQPLTVTAGSSNPGLIPTPAVNYASPGATGSLHFTPVAGASGTAIVSVTVDDGQSQNSSVTRSFTVTVNASNVAPTIALTSPTSSDSFTVPATVHLAAAASATGHTITKVQFFGGTNLVGEDSSAPYEFDWNAANAGSYSVVARLVYDGSSTVDSAPVIVTISDLPGPWAAGEIGTGAAAGAVSVAGDVYTVAGAGLLASTADSCRYVYQPLSADGEIKIRVNSAGEAGKNSRAGVMIRESMIPGAKYAFAGISTDGFFRWQVRTDTSGKTSSSAARGGMPGAWVRLVRAGNTLTSYRSYDGITWARLATANIDMAANIYVGLAVASGSPTTLTTSKFASPTVVP